MNTLSCSFALAVAVLVQPTAAIAANPTAEQLLEKYDAVMGPKTFEAETVMTATREDGSTRTYVMRMLKGENDKFRVWFREPSSVKGQEILRVGDNAWVYLPNLKRATRIANRDSFQGGDFNNADVLRVNYTADYAPTLVDSEVPGTYQLQLKAKTPNASYDGVKLWMRKSDLQPVRAQYFGASGQMLRSAEFSSYIEFDQGFVRPAKIVMRNELVKARQSVMETRKLSLAVPAPAQRFTQADLGR